MRAAVPPPSRPPSPPAARPPVRPPATPQIARPVSQPPAQGGLFGNMPPVQTRAPLPKAPPPPKQPARTGTVVEHPKYGTGTIVRREGEGDDAKITVIFQRHGMK